MKLTRYSWNNTLLSVPVINSQANLITLLGTEYRSMEKRSSSGLPPDLQGSLEPNLAKRAEHFFSESARVAEGTHSCLFSTEKA